MYSPAMAVSFSLAAVFGSALFGVITRLKKQEIAWFPAWFFAAGGLLFAPMGVYLSDFFSDFLAFAQLHRAHAGNCRSYVLAEY